MTMAICIRCGAVKDGALTLCSDCTFEPKEWSDKALATVFSENHTPVESLLKLSMEIKNGAGILCQQETFDIGVRALDEPLGSAGSGLPIQAFEVRPDQLILLLSAVGALVGLVAVALGILVGEWAGGVTGFGTLVFSVLGFLITRAGRLQVTPFELIEHDTFRSRRLSWADVDYAHVRRYRDKGVIRHSIRISSRKCRISMRLSGDPDRLSRLKALLVRTMPTRMAADWLERLRRGETIRLNWIDNLRLTSGGFRTWRKAFSWDCHREFHPFGSCGLTLLDSQWKECCVHVRDPIATETLRLVCANLGKKGTTFIRFPTRAEAPHARVATAQV